MFQLSNVDTFTSFIAGVKTVNRLGDDSTPVDGRRSLAADGAAILYHCPWFVINVRSGYNRSGWDDFAGKSVNMALATRAACRKPALKATVLSALVQSVNIGQLAYGQTTFDPRQLPDSVLAGFGVKIAPKVKAEQGDVSGWVAEQLRRRVEYEAFLQQRNAGHGTIGELQQREGFPAVRIVGDGRNRYVGPPGTKVLFPLPGGG